MSIVRVDPRVYLILYPGLAWGLDAIVAYIRGSREYILVDAGSGLEASTTALYSNISWLSAGLGSDPRPRLLLNTHGHVQNAGGDAWAHEVLGLVIAARPPDSRWIEEGDPEATGARELGLEIRPVPVGLVVSRDPFKVDWEGPIVEAYHTPGHTPGSQSILVESEKRVLFIGDSLGRLSHRWGSNEKEWWRSLDKVESLDPDVLCTSAVCYEGKAVKEFLGLVRSRGPEWID